MVQSIRKGEAVTFTGKWPTGTSFPNPPTWNVVEESGDVILQGNTAPTGNPNQWNAAFTIPINYDVPDGSAILEIEFNCVDSEGRSRDKAYSMEITDDNVMERQPYMVYYDGTNFSHVIDTDIVLTRIDAQVLDMAGNQIGSNMPTMNNPSAVSVNNGRNFYNLDWGGPITFPNSLSGGFHPYHMVITMTSARGVETRIEPIYKWTNYLINLVHQLKMYLDKAKLDEIDPYLRWNDDELIHYAYQGMMLINQHPPDLTFWTLTSFPPGMEGWLKDAAALEALNARYIAEGMTEFELSGLSTALRVDRKESLSYKIEELKGRLDQHLTAVKTKAISTSGPGTPPPGSGGGGGQTGNNNGNPLGPSLAITKPVGSVGTHWSPVSLHPRVGLWKGN